MTGRHKYGNKKDKNHNEIQAAFEALGFVAFDISNLPECFDLLVAKNGHTLCIEIKDGSKSRSARKLTTGEKKFASMWVRGGNWLLVESIEDVMAIHKKLIHKPGAFL